MNDSAIPSFWRGDLSTIEALKTQSKKGTPRTLAFSPGGRAVWCFSYGEKQQLISRANYNSACGANDLEAYLPQSGKKPVILLIGGVHGQETEGIVALCNLISLLETGVDLGGEPNNAVIKAAEKVRLLIVPCANPDGRARVEPPAMIGYTKHELAYWGQGTWKDGSLCLWPDCKKVHPILSSAAHLGGYFNDDGINLMHDQFFAPMAEETRALLKLAAEEFADMILLLHGGTNSLNDLQYPAYAPREVYEAIAGLAKCCDQAAQPEGLAFLKRPIPDMPSGQTPPSFNLTSALHHVGGAVSALFESNQCIVDEIGPKFTMEQIYRSHMILFEQTCLEFTKRMSDGEKEQ